MPSREETSVFAHIDDYISGFNANKLAAKEGLDERKVNEALTKAWNALYKGSQEIQNELYDQFSDGINRLARELDKKDLVLTIKHSRLGLIESCIANSDGTYTYSLLFGNGTIGAWYCEDQLILKMKNQTDLYNKWRKNLPEITKENSE